MDRWLQHNGLSTSNIICGIIFSTIIHLLILTRVNYQVHAHQVQKPSIYLYVTECSVQLQFIQCILVTLNHHAVTMSVDHARILDGQENCVCVYVNLEKTLWLTQNFSVSSQQSITTTTTHRHFNMSGLCLSGKGDWIKIHTDSLSQIMPWQLQGEIIINTKVNNGKSLEDHVGYMITNTEKFWYRNHFLKTLPFKLLCGPFSVPYDKPSELLPVLSDASYGEHAPLLGTGFHWCKETELQKQRMHKTRTCYCVPSFASSLAHHHKHQK